MNKYILFLLLVILFILVIRNKKVLLEGFESKEANKKTYYRILSELNGKALQPYKGYIDTSMIMTDKQDNYYPQLFSYENKELRNLYNNKYLTISDDSSKVLLSEYDKNKSQNWNVTGEGYIVSSNNSKLALSIEGGNTANDALVVVQNPTDKKEFRWKLEEIQVEIKQVEIVKGEQDGKTQYEMSGEKLTPSNGFSYSLWLFVGGMNYKKGEFKHILSRGDKELSQRTPGIFIDPLEQKLHVRFSTDKNKNDGIDKTKFSFDLDTWYYINFVFIDNKMTMYVNGQISEEYSWKGSIINDGNVFLNWKGGFDGKTANIEYVNKPLSIEEIAQKMKNTDPQKTCLEKREDTLESGNLVKRIQEWTNIELGKTRENEECPPKKMGGNTLSFWLKSGKIETNVELLENQYYTASIYVKSTKSINIRPYTKDWKGDWRTKKENEEDWIRFEWDFLNVHLMNSFGFEMNCDSKCRTAIYLPVLKNKLIRVNDGNIPVKEFRSNGTHSTCSILESGLNSITGWCSLNDIRERYYLEADFDKLYQVQKIFSRGRGDYPQWVTQYKIEYYDIYYNKWIEYGNSSIYEANKDMNSIQSNDVNIFTDKIRIYPVSYQSWPSMRVGFGGIETTKDKCKEYKVKSEIEQNILERNKYLELYNKECKMVSFYEHSLEIEKENKKIQELQQKLEKAEIDSRTYASKYKEIQENRNQKGENVKEIIETNNRNMNNSVKLDEKCQPIGEQKGAEGNTQITKRLKIENKKSEENKLVTLEDLSKQIQKILEDLDKKEKKLEKIEKELQINENQNKYNEKLTQKKQKTNGEIQSLRTQLKKCQSNFENSIEPFEDVPKETCPSKNDKSEQKIVSIDLKNSATCEGDKYDIRKHRQYKKLLDEIKNKMKEELTCKKKEICTPFNEMDIRKHKDFPKVVEYIYQTVNAKYEDIKHHKDFNKIVKEIHNKTIREYGRKTPNGYEKCPNECQLIKEIDIRKHPQFKEIVRNLVKDVVKKYGEPIPGTNPIVYRPCSAKNNLVSNNRKDMSAQKCLQNFNFSQVETFEDYKEYEDFQDVAKQHLDTFDIRYHRQYHELMKNVVPISKVEQLVKESTDKLKKQYSNEIATIQKQSIDGMKLEDNIQYKNLVEAYKECKKGSLDITQDPKYQKLLSDFQGLKTSSEKVKETCQNALATGSSFDITRHPDIDKYVLKSSLPIDLSVKKLYDEQILLLKSEIAKLQKLSSKCTQKFDLSIETFVGTPQIDSNDAKVLLEKVDMLLVKLNKNLSVEDKKRFEEIKSACRQAMNVGAKLDEQTRNFVQNMYNEILLVQNNQKRLEDVLNKYLKNSTKEGIRSDLTNLLQAETVKEENKKVLQSSKDSLEKLRQEILKDTNMALQESQKVIQKAEKKVESTAVVEDVRDINKMAVQELKENVGYLRKMRKGLEKEKKDLEVKYSELEKKFDKVNNLLTDYKFKSDNLGEELKVLRNRCNDRITKLWTDNTSIRKSVESREESTRKRESMMDRKQNELEEREEQLSGLKNSTMDKYQYFQNKVQEERSVADRYREELNKLKDSLETEKQKTDKARMEMNEQISKIREECGNRVDRYRKMYEEGEKLLSELRTKTIETPALVEKVNIVESKMAKKVQEAVNQQQQLQVSPQPTPQQQTSIDKQLLEDMKKLVLKVDDIEKKLSKTPTENMMWYNNKYSMY